MEFSSEIMNLIGYIEESPHIMVLWSAFGIFFCIFLLSIPMYIIRKLGFGKYFEKPFAILIGVILVSWGIGFVTQIILFFSGVSGLRLMLIWSVMFMTYLIFGLFNRKMIFKWANEKSVLKRKGA